MFIVFGNDTFFYTTCCSRIQLTIVFRWSRLHLFWFIHKRFMASFLCSPKRILAFLYITIQFENKNKKKERFRFACMILSHTHFVVRWKYAEHNSFRSYTVNSKCLDTSNKKLSIFTLNVSKNIIENSCWCCYKHI